MNSTPSPISSTRSTRWIRRSIASAAVAATVAVAGLQGVASADASDANPTLSNTASSGWWAGTSIFDSGNLSGGANPTGSITFNLYGPDDPTCTGTPMFTTTTQVNGNGYYQSASMVTDTAGTYHWMSSYGGDVNNNPTAPSACGLANATVYVGKRNVGLSALTSLVSATGVVTDTATLSQGVGPDGPTGTITWTVFGPNNLICSGPPVFTSVKTVTGNGTYTADPFVATAAGKYSWKLTYSGDSNNNGQFTICSDTANQFNYAGSTPMTLTAGPSAVNPGDALTVTWSGVPSPVSSDWIGLYRVGSYSPIAWRYTGGTVSGSTLMTVPLTAAAGNYEVRLRTVKSGVVVVS